MADQQIFPVIAVTAAPEYLERVRANIGRDTWLYKGQPEAITVNAGMGIQIQAWWFDFTRIEPDVRLHMLTVTSALRQMSLEEADNYLTQAGIAIPIDQISLQPVKESAEESTMP